MNYSDVKRGLYCSSSNKTKCRLCNHLCKKHHNKFIVKQYRTSFYVKEGVTAFLDPHCFIYIKKINQDSLITKPSTMFLSNCLENSICAKQKRSTTEAPVKSPSQCQVNRVTSAFIHSFIGDKSGLNPFLQEYS